PAPPLPSCTGVPVPPLQSCTGVPAPPLPSCTGVLAPPLQSCTCVPAPPLQSCTGVPAPPLQSCTGVPSPPHPSCTGVPAPPHPSCTGVSAPPLPSCTGVPAPPHPLAQVYQFPSWTEMPCSAFIVHCELLTMCIRSCSKSHRAPPPGWRTFSILFFHLSLTSLAWPFHFIGFGFFHSWIFTMNLWKYSLSRNAHSS
ncbi:unnamed protein product, partial [Staurois parvus]